MTRIYCRKIVHVCPCVCIYVHFDNLNIVSEQCQTLNWLFSQANIEMPLWHFWHPGTWVVPVNSIKNLFPLEKSLFFYTQFKSFKYFYILAIATFRIYNRNNRIIELEFRAKPVKYKPVSCWVSLGKDFKNVTCGYRRTGGCSSPHTQESTVGTRNTMGTAYSVKTKYSGSVVVGISVKLHHQKQKFEPKVFQSYEKMNSQSACLCSTMGPVWP